MTAATNHDLAPDSPDHAVRPSRRTVLHVVVQGTVDCNYRCDYCYVVPETHSQSKYLSRETWSRFLDAASDTSYTDFDFSWQGGEPTLLGVSRFEALLDICDATLKQRGKRPWHSIHTNGRLLDERWLPLLVRHGFSVGISLDGYPGLQDEHPEVPSRHPSALRTALRAIKMTHREGLHTSVTATFPAPEAIDVERLYGFYKTLPVDRINVEPCLAPPDQAVPEGRRSRLREFVDHVFVELFRQWWADEPSSRPPIGHFRELVAILGGSETTVCHLGGGCWDHVTLQPDGLLFPCDHFVGLDEYVLGNVAASDLRRVLETLGDSPASRRFEATRAHCECCPHFGVCRGGCAYQNLTQSPVGDGQLRVARCWRRGLFEQVSAILLEG